MGGVLRRFRCWSRTRLGWIIGATEIYIAVPVGRDSEPVQRFATFTEDLIAAADWNVRERKSVLHRAGDVCLPDW
jgi:hypothetical protein